MKEWCMDLIADAIDWVLHEKIGNVITFALMVAAVTLFFVILFE
jgi:hypothetical protein